MSKFVRLIISFKEGKDAIYPVPIKDVNFHWANVENAEIIGISLLDQDFEVVSDQDKK